MRLAVCDDTCLFKTMRGALARILIYGICLVLLGGLAKAQDSGLSVGPRTSSDHATAIRVNSDLVQIPVSVLDPDGRSIVGLPKDSFRLLEDKVEQVVTHFAMEDAPVSVGFVFDASASMRPKLYKAREAVTAFLKTANLQDEFFFVQFNDNVDLVVGLTSDVQDVERQLNFIQPAGKTALLDAIYISIHQMQKAHNARKAIVIVSDGGDNCSRYSIGEVKSLVRETDVQIYALGVFDRPHSPEEVAGPELLREVAKQSGGRAFEIKDVNELPDLASKVGTALRSQYVLGYSPNKKQRDGKYHHVEVKLAQPKGSRKLQASWRRGYYAPVESGVDSSLSTSAASSK